MKYLLLLYEHVKVVEALGAAQRRAIVDDHVRFAAILRERGAHVTGEPLHGPDRARTIRFDGNGASVTDGPFLESKEALGGFYVIEAADEPAAIELAKQVPRSPTLVAELRPIADV
jgi:hypothetical protein